MMEKIQNRRRGPDVIIKSIKVFTILSWIGILAIIIAAAAAKQGTGGSPLANRLMFRINADIFKYVLYLLIVQALLCGIGLAIAATRMKRKTDKLNFSLLFFEILSIIGIIVYIIVT